MNAIAKRSLMWNHWAIVVCLAGHSAIHAAPQTGSVESPITDQLFPQVVAEVLSQESDSDEVETVADSISELIAKLESRTFARREQATEDLVAKGCASLRPLVRNLEGTSPEIAYRTRKIIQEIAVSDDEATFLKAAGTLKLVLFGTCNGNDHAMRPLETEWKRRRTVEAARQLESNGAIVKLAASATVQPRHSITICDSDDRQSERLGPLQMEKTIDAILVGSNDRNRELVFGRTVSIDPGVRIQLEEDVFGNRGGFNRHFDGAVDPTLAADSNEVLFDENWTGTDRDFAKVAAISSVVSVTLKKQPLTPARLRTLQRISGLRVLQLESCSLAADDVGLFKGLDDVRTLELSGQERSGEIISQFASRSLSTIRLSGCHIGEFEVEQLQNLASVNHLMVAGVDLPADVLYQLAELNQLRVLNLEQCSFNLDVLRRIQRRRASDVQINALAKAFLGVRGPDFGGGFECRITEVIPDSGAEKAGVEIGDVITRINDQKVETFEDLKLCISQFDIGDDLRIVVERGGRELELTASLSERGPLVE